MKSSLNGRNSDEPNLVAKCCAACKILFPEIGKFALVSGLCASLDLGVGILLIQTLNVSIYLSCSLGWLIGIVCGYLLHLHWTFSRSGVSHSGMRALLFAGNGILLLAIRWICIWGLLHWIESPEIVLVLAVAASFCVNFTISKFFIFSR